MMRLRLLHMIDVILAGIAIGLLLAGMTRLAAIVVVVILVLIITSLESLRDSVSSHPENRS